MMSLRVLLPLACVLGVWLLTGRWASASPDVTKRAREFVKGHEKRIKPLDVANNKAWWDASTTGTDEAFDKKTRAQNRLDEALSDRKVFAELKALKDKHDQIDDPVTARA